MNRLGHLHLWARKKAEALGAVRWCWPGDSAEMKPEHLAALLGGEIPESARRNFRGNYSVRTGWLEAHWRAEALARYGEDIGWAARNGLYLPPSFGQIRAWMELVATRPPADWNRKGGASAT